MLENLINFLVHPDLIDDKELLPIPAKQDIPNWYKKLENYSPNSSNIKGCIPVRDSITSGYLLKLPVSIHIKFNWFNSETKQKDVIIKFGRIIEGIDIKKLVEYNINTDPSSHHINQLGEDSPHIKRNQSFPIMKIHNPFIIKTPPGYSCLFVPPQHRSRDYFEILPAIVDTDSYNTQINFPIVFCGEKKEQFETVIEKGTPYVQVIPFKRDNWKMKINEINMNQFRKDSFKYVSNLINIYLKKHWFKKTWK